MNIHHLFHMVHQYNIKTLFLLYKGDPARGSSSPRASLNIYIYIFFFYTSVADIFVAPVKKKNTKQIERHWSSRVCLKDESMWREQEWKLRKTKHRATWVGLFYSSECLIVPRQAL